MPRFGTVRPFAAVRLLIASAALVSAQQFAGAAAFAQSDPAAESDLHRFQPLQQAAISTPPLMNAAVSGGQFEDLVTPALAPKLTPIITPPPSIVTPPAPAPPKPRIFESGVASTYGEGDGFEGNLTACGQVFHTAVVQVAHKSLPCGTMVRVEDRDTGLSVEAEVTDRGPYIAGRIVDLSWGAFRQLEPSGPGLLHVNVYVLS